MPTQPPFTISAKIIHLVSRISESLGRINQDYLKSSPQLRKQNRIKTIAGTLAIDSVLKENLPLLCIGFKSN